MANMVGKRQKKNEFQGVDPQLNADSIYEVMIRLPIMAIFTCAAVCKSWYAVTKDPLFRKQISRLQSKYLGHIILQPTTQNKSQLNIVTYQPEKSITLPVEPMLHELEVMSSCEGMLSMASVTKLDPVVIYNPLTKEKHVLPPSRGTKSSVIFYQQVGIGYDEKETKKRFKVLRAFCICYGSRFIKKYEILTLGEGEVSTWRRLRSPKCIGRLQHYKVNYCLGSLYFVTRPGCPFRVVRFNPSDETFCHISVGPNETYYVGYKFFGIFDDDEGSVFLAMGNGNRVGISKLDYSKARPGELAFTNQFWSKFTTTELSSCNVLAQVEKENYLVHYGISGSFDSRLEHVGIYCSNPHKYSHCKRLKVPNEPTSFAFKPSLMPLPSLPPATGAREEGDSQTRDLEAMNGELFNLHQAASPFLIKAFSGFFQF